MKTAEKNLAIANADIRNLKMKINGLENVDIKKLVSKLAAITDLLCRNKAGSQMSTFFGTNL